MSQKIASMLLTSGALRRLVGALIVGIATHAGAVAIQPAGAPDARAIMQRVEDFDDGDNQVSDIELTLTDREGNRKIRKMVRLAKNFGADKRDEYAYNYFYAPQELNGMSVLTFDYHDDSKEDDTWVYIPQLNKTKRMTSQDKTGRLAGSDINYGDLVQRDTSLYDFTFLREEKVGKWSAWAIEFVPKTEEEIRRFGYSKGIAWVDKESYRVVRSIFWKAENNEVKYFEVYDMENISGIWTPLEMSFMVKKGDVVVHRTDMRIAGTRYNQNLDARLFDPARLGQPLPPEFMPVVDASDAGMLTQNTIDAKRHAQTARQIAGMPIGVFGSLMVLSAIVLWLVMGRRAGKATLKDEARQG